MKKLAALFMTFSLVFSLGSGSVVMGEENADQQFFEENGFSKELYEKHVTYRAANNLGTDVSNVKRAIESTNAKHAEGKYSIAMTSEEEAYIAERDKLMEQYGDEIASILRDGEEFMKYATFHQETSSGLKFVVGISEENKITQGYINEIKKLVPSEFLEIRNVEFSEKELVGAVDALVESEDTIEKDTNHNLENVYVDIPNNQIDLTVSNLSVARIASVPIDTNKTNDMLKNKFGVDFSVTVGAGPKKQVAQSYPPDKGERELLNDYMFGGLEINLEREIGSIHCTAGFSATKNGERFLVTAGHCTNKSTYIYQGGEIIGSNHFRYIGSKADVGLIKLTSNKYLTSKLYKGSTMPMGQYTSYQKSRQDMSIGDKVCFSGATTGFQCGQVISTYGSQSNGDSLYPGLIVASGMDSEGGDSGAPFWYNDVLLGILTAGYDGSSKLELNFTHVSEAISLGGNVTPYFSN